MPTPGKDENDTKSNKRSHTEFAGQEQDGEHALLRIPYHYVPD